MKPLSEIGAYFNIGDSGVSKVYGRLLCKRFCKKRNVSLSELLSGSRRRELVNARRIISWLAVHELGYSGAEVARHPGVTTSSITRFLALEEKPDIEGIIYCLRTFCTNFPF
ncbi:MAG: hypothetical protein JW882_08395 [Deltaproteobacteria bacterium]|nr:hypothetical protein [Deltaproteobacteria bacterium]